MRKNASLKSRLILYSLSITFGVLVALAGISYLTVRGFLREGQAETTRYKLRIAMDSIDRDMNRLVQLVSWCTVSPEVTAFVSSSAAYPEDRRFKALSAHRSVRDAITGNGLDSYVDKLLIGSLEGFSVQFGILQGHKGDFDVARAQLGRLGENSPPGWGGLVDLGFAFGAGRAAIPVAKGISSDDDSNRTVGFVFMAVNQEVLWRFLSGYDLDAGSRLYLAIGDSVYAVGEGKSLEPASLGVSGARLILAARQGRTSMEARPDGGPEGRATTLVLAGGRDTGWVLAQSLPPLRLLSQSRGLLPFLLMVALSIFVLVSLVLVAVNRTVNQPIARINRRVALVSKGDFSHDADIEWENELGDIGRAINRLSRDLELLIERRVEDEKAKKALEFRALQSQINPHFLYNALNAIKWMAEIQKATGIAEMTNSLASLLRHAARDSDALVTLDLELELVGEYCTIQRYRSANLFETEVFIRDESLRRCKVVKFTLQPIVENAIMHGIEPKMAPGRIRIDIDRPEPGLVRIDVTDDGVGIEPERIGEVLGGGARDDEAFNHIGLYNVDERLKLAFGEGFGLSIESVKGSYTRVSVLIPFIAEGEGEPCIRC